jgi:hypothetical protein
MVTINTDINADLYCILSEREILQEMTSRKRIDGPRYKRQSAFREKVLLIFALIAVFAGGSLYAADASFWDWEEDRVYETVWRCECGKLNYNTDNVCQECGADNPNGW